MFLHLVAEEAPNMSHGGDTCSRPSWLALGAFMSSRHIFLFCSATFFALAAGAIVPILGILLGSTFQQFTEFNEAKTSESAFRGHVSTYATYLAALGAASWLFNTGSLLLWCIFGELQALAARLAVFEALTEQPTAWYDQNKNGIGALLPRIEMHIRELQTATSQPLGYLVESIATMLVALSIAFCYSWRLTLVILATVPISIFFVYLISRRMEHHIADQQEHLMRASHVSYSAIANIETVKCFNAQHYEHSKYLDAVRDAAKFYLKQARANATRIAYLRFATMAMFVQGFWYGSHLVSAGRISTGAVLTTFWSCLTATQAFEQILPQIIVLEKGRSAGYNLRQLLLVPEDSANSMRSVGGLMPRQAQHAMEFKMVAFAYASNPRHDTLKDVSCYFEAGRLTFIVGKSGSGKSTIAQLLTQMYLPSCGGILLDGIPLTALDIHWLRQNVLLIEQDTTIFAETLGFNLTLGKEVSKIRLKTAIEFAMLQDIIADLPEELQTIVGSGGRSLSGGQRQRVALARARLRDPAVLILDEPTSSLDLVTRSLIMDAIRHWRNNKTTIIITHDVSCIRDDDQLYLLEHGKVVAKGAKATLERTHDYEFARFSRHSRESDIETIQLWPQWPAPSSPSRSINQDVDDVPESHVLADYSSTVGSAIAQPDPFAHTGRTSRAPATDITYRFESTSFFGDNTGWRNTGTVSNSHILTRFPSPRRPSSILQTTPSSAVPLKFLMNALPSSENYLASSHNSLNIHTSRSRPSTRPLSAITFSAMERSGNKAVQSRVRHARYGSASLRVDPQHNTPSKHESYRSSTYSVVEVLLSAWHMLRGKDKAMLILGLMCAMLHAIAVPMFSWLFSKLLSTLFIAGSTSKMALIYSVSIGGLAMSDAVVAFFMHSLLESCSQTWIDSIRSKVMRRLLNQAREFFLQQDHSATRFTQMLYRNAEEMRNLLARFTAFLLMALVMTVVALLWSISVCWKLALVGIATTPILLTITHLYQRVSAVCERKCNTAADQAVSTLGSTFINLRTIRLWDLDAQFHQKHARSLKRILRRGVQRAIYSAIFYGLSESTSAFITALLLNYAAVLASSRTFDMEDILLVLTMLLFTMDNLTAIIAYIPQISSSCDTASILLNLANLPEWTHEDNGSRPLLGKSGVGEIALKQVFFSYPGYSDETTLNGLDASFSPGTLTAIVGPSGSGKSTILNLLTRLFETGALVDGDDHGISVDGREIDSLNIKSLRSAVAVVPQNPMLFPATIADNIDYGVPKRLPNRHNGDVRRVAAAAGIDHFIESLPNRYETMIGDGGIGLSVGQAQRIAIARALMRDAQVLLMDEPTSALDPENAQHIRQTLVRLMHENASMTIIVVTHAVEMMEITDRIMVVKHGRVVEEGTFAKLTNGHGELSTLLRSGKWSG